MAGQSQTDLFDSYFRRADLDGDGRISGAEAVAFFQGFGLPQQVLAQVWTHADQRRSGFLGRAEFYNALKLITVAQSKRELIPDIVKAALYGPASAKIPAPKINLAALAVPQSNSNAAAPVPQSASSQNMGIRAPHVLANASLNQQHIPSQQNQFMRPPQAMPPGTASRPQQIVAGQGMHEGGIMPPNSNMSADWLGGRTGSPSAGLTSQFSNRELSPSTTQNSFGLTTPGLAPSIQPGSQTTTGQTPSAAPKPQDSAMLSKQVENKDSKGLVVSGNGFASDSLFGDVFSATPSQPKQDNLAAASSASTLPVSAAISPVTAGPQQSFKSGSHDSLQNTFTQQPVGGQVLQGQTTGKQGQQVPPQSSTTSTSSGFAAGSASSQSQLPWPKMTQSDVQKYTKVFVEVDTDRDGKITGEQARNLFLSWRLPREVLKQVWDLSDQDNDSMLSLREFCTALYLMERYREGRPLPAVLPRTVIFDESLFSASGQPASPYGNAVWGPAAGLPQPQVKTGMRPITPASAARPPRPPSVPHDDGTMQPIKQKPKVPELEKHLVNQLSKEEQDSLESKFQDATQADKKVAELEKEISDSREKIDFYRTKMQEIILYKSRCDNRLNEVMERVSSDKLEVDSLVKKYEEKCKQVGDVASKLTIEEATFRDIQEKKMGLYQAIVKMEEGGSADGALQARADNIHSGLEELVKTVNERCKKYGLHVKPTSLIEIPFGWQPGVQEGAADWDEDWDKFEDEGFTYVKDLTLDVQNVIAPAKPKYSSVRKEKTSADEGVTSSSPNLDAKSEKVSGMGEQVPENGLAHDQCEDSLSRSAPDSPVGKIAVETHSQEFQDSRIRKGIGAYDSPRAKDTQSDHGGAEPVLSGEKSFDEPGWGTFDRGTFDTHYDTDSVWSLDTDRAKDIGHERNGENYTFDGADFGLNPIRTQAPHTGNMFPGKSTFPFADSVPSTPALPGKSTFAFADSVPSTPAYNFGNSPRRFSEGPDDHSFDNFSRFDSFRTHDSGFIQSPRNSFARFDSIRSTKDSDLGHGFDSFSMQDSGFFQSPRHSLSRFDSMRSTNDTDYSHGFDSFSMHESGLFQSSGNSFARFDSFRSSKDPEEHHKDHDHSHGFPSFDDTDPFGSSGPFRTSLDNQTPRSGSDHWSAF